MKQLQLSSTAGGSLNWRKEFGNLVAFVKNEYMQPITHNSILLSIHKSAYIHQKKCTKMFMSALFIVAPNWKFPRYLMKSKWITKLWYF